MGKIASESNIKSNMVSSSKQMNTDSISSNPLVYQKQMAQLSHPVSTDPATVMVYEFAGTFRTMGSGGDLTGSMKAENSNMSPKSYRSKPFPIQFPNGQPFMGFDGSDDEDD